MEGGEVAGQAASSPANERSEEDEGVGTTTGGGVGVGAEGKEGAGGGRGGVEKAVRAAFAKSVVLKESIVLVMEGRYV